MWYLTLSIRLTVLRILIAMSKLHLRDCSSPWLKGYNGATFDDRAISNLSVICPVRHIFRNKFSRHNSRIDSTIDAYHLCEWLWPSFYNTVSFTYRRSKTRETYFSTIKSPKFYHPLVRTYITHRRFCSKFISIRANYKRGFMHTSCVLCTACTAFKIARFCWHYTQQRVPLVDLCALNVH